MQTTWPSKGPDFNSWQINLPDFIKVLEDAKHSGFWCADFDLKYLTVRIDTRDNAWLLFIDSRKEGGEKTRIDPQRVLDAISKWNERVGDSKPYGPRVTDDMVERATMKLLGAEKDHALGIDWLVNRTWTVNDVRALMRAALEEVV